MPEISKEEYDKYLKLKAKPRPTLDDLVWTYYKKLTGTRRGQPSLSCEAGTLIEEGLRVVLLDVLRALKQETGDDPTVQKYIDAYKEDR